MEELLKKADELGRLLAAHERFTALMAARDGVRGDEAASKLLADYETQVQKLQKQAAENKPIEVEDKRALADLEQQVASNDAIKAFAAAQADFSEMMSRINRAIYQKIAPAPDEESPAGG
jgi:cell fate (sporulation/competence/biofilm development) regulator YlbF (YheA/YmcA/DUF963 family)